MDDRLKKEPPRLERSAYALLQKDLYDLKKKFRSSGMNQEAKDAVVAKIIKLEEDIAKKMKSAHTKLYKDKKFSSQIHGEKEADSLRKREFTPEEKKAFDQKKQQHNQEQMAKALKQIEKLFEKEVKSSGSLFSKFEEDIDKALADPNKYPLVLELGRLIAELQTRYNLQVSDTTRQIMSRLEVDDRSPRLEV